MKVPFLDLSRMDADFKVKLKERFSEMLDNGRFSGGEEVSQFEELAGNYLNTQNFILLGNGTDALEIALRALGIGVGDEVIVPAMTWVSTAEVVKLVGAKPVFVDTDSTGSISESWFEHCTSKTKAVMPVHLYGKMVNMNPLMKEAKARGLFVVEDAAQSFGAFDGDLASGTIGDIGAFSFYPTKNLGALGEAGGCTTNDPDLADKIRMVSNHGQKLRDEHFLAGRNARVDTLQAGFLHTMFLYFGVFLRRRREQAEIYLDAFKSLEEIKLPKKVADREHNAHLFVIQTERRDELKSFLSKKGIGTAIHYPKILPDLEPFKTQGDFPNARKLAAKGLSLPLNPYLTEEEQQYVISGVLEFFDT